MAKRDAAKQDASDGCVLMLAPEGFTGMGLHIDGETVVVTPREGSRVCEVPGALAAAMKAHGFEPVEA